MGFNEAQMAADLLTLFDSDPATSTIGADGVAAAVADNHSDADLSGHALLAGRAGGQILNGGTGDGDDLELISTAHANKGDIKLGGLTADKDGDVGLGTGAPAHRLDVLDSLVGYVARLRNDSAAATGHIFNTRMGADDGSGTTYWAKVDDGNGTLTGYLQTIAGVFQLTDVSDMRMKSDVAETKVEGLDVIEQIELKEFRYERQGPDAFLHPIGFSAQNLQQAFPYAVSEDEEGTLTTSRAALIPVLVKAVQELTAQNAALQARIEALEK